MEFKKFLAAFVLLLFFAVAPLEGTFASNVHSETQSLQTQTSLNEALELLQNVEIKNAELYFEQCKLRVSGTIGGEQIDLTLEFEADNCFKAYAEILKNLKDQ